MFNDPFRVCAAALAGLCAVGLACGSGSGSQQPDGGTPGGGDGGNDGGSSSGGDGGVPLPYTGRLLHQALFGLPEGWNSVHRDPSGVIKTEAVPADARWWFFNTLTAGP